jgi:DNA-binding NtrC family response regulator
VEPLAVALTARACRAAGLQPKALGAEALERLRAYHWPGNVRELENVLVRAVILTGRQTVISSDALAFLAHGSSAQSFSFEQIIDCLSQEIISKRQPLAEVERALIRTILKHFDGKVLKAIEETGIPKHRFYKYR